jgi:hypothetical protein
MRLYLALLAAALIAGAAGLFVRRWAVVAGGASATGKVVDFETREDEGTLHYLPVVVFADREGRTHRFTSVAGGARPRPPRGSLVTVRYRPEHPDQAYIASFLHLWAAPLGMLVLGLGAWWAYWDA